MIVIVFTVIAFAVIHSILAQNRVKDSIRARMGERAYLGLYRILYNILAVLTLAPALVAIAFTPSPIIWRVEGIPAVLLVGLQGIGLVGLTVSLLQTDILRFGGVTQLMAWLSDQPLPLPPESLRTDGVYALVRHPLYLFSLLMLWPMAVMTESLLAFNIAATAYFVIGSIIEERRMVNDFGEPYIRYRQNVPWLFPFVKKV
ncbi:MAG: isoprenylcysteine carboxylmethyltransferase family protein [Anaerolineae bacterium]|nr:isoprenylcysteine carboxylmethyltransferase family protein [Anaerolineae bacterium]